MTDCSSKKFDTLQGYQSAKFRTFKRLLSSQVLHITGLPIAQVCDFQRVSFPQMFDLLQSCQLAQVFGFQKAAFSKGLTHYSIANWPSFVTSKWLLSSKVFTLQGCQLAWFYDFKGLVPLKV
jgi:hypothetical protein